MMKVSWKGSLPAVVLAAYGLLLAPVFFSWAFVPDEVWFQRDARAIAAAAHESGWWQRWLEQPPHLGYGALFWWSYARLLDALPFWTGLWTARVIVWLCLLSVPLALWRGAQRPWPVLLLWFSLPMAWWTGKLNAPEIPVLALCAWALALAGRAGTARLAAAGALAGLAIGLKLTALAILPALLLLALVRRRGLSAERFVAEVLLALALLAGAFLLANPVALLRPDVFLAALAGAGTAAAFTPDALARLLWADHWEWDVIPSGGILAHGISLAALALLLAAAVSGALRHRRDAWLLLALLATALSVLLLFVRERFLVWYAFPALLALVFVVARLTPGRLGTALVTLAAGAQLVLHGPHIVDNVRLKLDHAARLERLADLRARLNEELGRLPTTRLLLDLSETGMELAPEPAPPLATAAQVRRGLDALHYVTAGLPPATGENDRVVLIIGERLRRSPLYADEHFRTPEWLGGWRLTASRQLPGAATLLLFESGPAFADGSPAGR